MIVVEIKGPGATLEQIEAVMSKAREIGADSTDRVTGSATGEVVVRLEFPGPVEPVPSGPIPRVARPQFPSDPAPQQDAHTRALLRDMDTDLQATVIPTGAHAWNDPSSLGGAL